MLKSFVVTVDTAYSSFERKLNEKLNMIGDSSLVDVKFSTTSVTDGRVMYSALVIYRG